MAVIFSEIYPEYDLMGVYLLSCMWFYFGGGGGEEDIKKANKTIKQPLQSEMPQSQYIYHINHINDNLSFTSKHNLFCHLFPWQRKQTILHPLFL